MNEDLNEILKFYEEEKENLESLIKDNIYDGEYKEAHRNQKAQILVNNSLSLLRKLGNSNHEEIEQLEYLLHNYSSSRYTKLVEDNPKMKAHQETEKKYLEQKIKSLKEKPIPYQVDEQDFDDMIFKLVEGRIKGFQFFINLENHLYLDFKKHDNQILITIPKYKKLKKNFILFKENVAEIKKIGFQLSANKKELHYFYNLANFKNAIEIKTISSRVIYDCFGYRNLKNSSLIVIVN